MLENSYHKEYNKRKVKGFMSRDWNTYYHNHINLHQLIDRSNADPLRILAEIFAKTDKVILKSENINAKKTPDNLEEQHHGTHRLAK